MDTAKVLVAKVVHSRYPRQPVYCRDLEEVRVMIDHIFVDDPDRTDYTFEDWMGQGEVITITMEYVTQEFSENLEEFESY